LNQNNKIELLITKELLKRELSSRNISDFVKYTNKKYILTRFHEAYCRIIQSFSENKIRKLIITIPPQHGKSEISTRKLPAFILGQDPSQRIAVMSYSTEKARRFGRDIKRTIQSKEYHNIFPKTRLPYYKEAGYSNASEIVDIPAGEDTGSLFFVGRNGGLTGETVDTLIMDDLYKNQMEANSPLIRQNVIDMYNTVAESRLHNDSRQLIVFTRWHDNDLVGYITENEEYEVIKSFEQIDNADHNKWYVVSFEALKTNEKTEIDNREIEDPLFPEKHSKKKLFGIRDRLLKSDPEMWESLYQNNPRPITGLLYGNGFKEYDIEPEIRDRLAYIDVADQGKDKLCCICYNVGVDNYMYEREIYYTSDPAEITENEVADMLIRNKVNIAWFESNAGGKSYARNVQRILQEKGMNIEIKWFHQSGNKESRVITNASNIMRLFLMSHGWMSKYPLFAKDVLGFRKIFKANKFDDGPDTLTGCYEFSGIDDDSNNIYMGIA